MALSNAFHRFDSLNWRGAVVPIALAILVVAAFAPAAGAQEVTTLHAGCSAGVTWTVGGADTVLSVNILLVDGEGDTLATLASGAPNDGSADVVVPCIEADTLAARLRVVAVLPTPFNFLDEAVVVVSVPPTITTVAEGGPVDENCERLVEFSATIEDDCGVVADSVDATVTLTTGNATLSAVAVEKENTEAGVELTGSFVVSALTGSPAEIIIEVLATDHCDNLAVVEDTVFVFDATPPTVELALNRYALWPPNHKFHDVWVTVSAFDACDPEPTYSLVSVTSNEDANGKGDGNTSPDVHGADVGTADVAFELRAERAGNGDGRVYTVIYTASDASGNTASASATVIVPHDQRGKAKSSNGYDRFGAGFDTAAGRFAIIVPSDPAGAFDATAIDARGAQIGNMKGVVSAEAAYRGDADGDGRDDVVLVFPTSTAQELHLWAKGHQDMTSLHYSNGRDHWVVYDIFALGAPLPVDLSAMTLLADEGSADGDGAGDGGGDADESGRATPATRLSARPNPFNPQATVTYELATGGPVSVRIYDVQGRLVRTLANRSVPAGEYHVTWDGLDERGQPVSSGVYFVRMETQAQGITKKIVMVK